MINKIDNLLMLTGQKIALLTELKNSLLYNSCIYDLVKLENNTFILFEITTKKEIVSGPKNRINSYIKIRSIDTKKIFNY